MSRVPRLADRGHIRLRATMRMPILSNGAQSEGAFTCYEKQQRMNGSLHQRYRAVELARIDDALVVDFIAGRRHQQLGSLNSRNASELDLTVAEVLAYYELATCAEAQVVDALRRLTGTLITLGAWKGRQYPRQFPFMEARRTAPGRFAITPSAWFDAELMDGEIVSAPQYSSRLSSFRFRLDGWARSWVGRNPETGDQIITQRDAGARAGNLPDAMPGITWEHILRTVALNDVPGFELELIEHRGQPAVRVREHGTWYPDANSRAVAAHAEVTLEGENDDEAVPAVPREIGLDPDEPEMPPRMLDLGVGLSADDHLTVIRPILPIRTRDLGPLPRPVRELSLD